MLTTFNTNKGKFLTRIYTYGNLEKECGYDLISCLDDELFKEITSTTTCKEIETIFISKNRQIPVVVILWVEPRFNSLIGMVVDKNDIKSYSLAKQRQYSKELAIV